MKTFEVLRDLCALIVTAIIRWLSNLIRVPVAACIVALAITSVVSVEQAYANDPVVAVLHVNIDRPWEPPDPDEDGESWDSAYRFLQDAVAHAKFLLDEELAEEVHIWIAAAFDQEDPPNPIPYRPDQWKNHWKPDCVPGYDNNCCPPYGNCDWTETFDFSNFAGDIHLLGGFPPDPHLVGPNGATLDHRDPAAHQTILSGDLWQNDDFSWGYDANGVLQLNYDNYCDIEFTFCNSTQLITHHAASAMLVLDGLTLTSANGEAIFAYGALRIQDCIIEKNQAGGMELRQNNVQIRRSIVRYNGRLESAFTSGIFLSAPVEALIIDTEVYRNAHGWPGGGIYVSGPATLVNVKVWDNVSKFGGGGVFAGWGDAEVRMWNCLITDNRALGDCDPNGGGPPTGGGTQCPPLSGGGVAVSSWPSLATLEMINCTVAGNRAPAGGGIGLEFGAYAQISNSIIWGNTNDDEQPDGIYVDNWPSHYSAQYSNLQDCADIPECPGIANHGLDPLFVDPDNQDKELRDYRLQAESPCIDTGDWTLLPCDKYTLDCEVPGVEDALACPDANECDPPRKQRHPIDLDSMPRVTNSGTCEVDMGAYEFAQGEGCRCVGDILGDCNVGVPDLLALLAAWGPCADPEDCPADLTGNGSVGVGDLLALLGAWGPCPGEDPPGESCDALEHQLVQDCLANFFSTIAEFEACVEWVVEHRTPYPGP